MYSHIASSKSHIYSLVKIQHHVCESQGLNSFNLSKMKEFLSFKKPKSQLDFYKEKGASPEILKYVDIPGKTFGEKYMERLTKEFFNLDKRTCSGHDHTLNGIRIEQKSARYHANGNDWKWQHIELKHTWDALLVTGLDFNDIKFYIASRKTVEQLIYMNIIVGQGKKDDNGIAQAQQAYWFSRSDFKKKNISFTNYFTPIKSINNINRFIANLP